MSKTPAAVSVLSDSECWTLLSGTPLGRLVTTVDGQSDVFPVNFIVQNRTVLFRTAEGTKLVAAAINRTVLFEADGYNVSEGWSVVVKGLAHTLRDDEILDAERDALPTWTATSKEHFVRIRPVSVSGRRFIFGPAPAELTTLR